MLLRYPLTFLGCARKTRCSGCSLTQLEDRNHGKLAWVKMTDLGRLTAKRDGEITKKLHEGLSMVLRRGSTILIPVLVGFFRGIKCDLLFCKQHRQLINLELQ